jgi:DNA-directed RNA polymerase subunit RPC12/RpoP
MFEKAEIGIPCPKCSHKTNKTIAWIKANDQVACGGCGSTIHLESEKLLSGLKEAEKSMAKLRKTMGSLGKRR